MLFRRFLALLCAAMLLPVAALADGSMSFEEIQAIWEASSEKMNARAYAPEYSRLPGEDDLPYEEALAIAKKAVYDKYGASADFLDAMGVYPNFVYDRWEIYWNSARDFFVPSYPANTRSSFDAVEYIVTVSSPSGDVISCRQRWRRSMADFWAEADALWSDGWHDMIYKQARTASFYRLTAAEQEHFLALMDADGYDASPIQAGGWLLEDEDLQRELNRADLSLAVEAEDDALVAAAWQALEDAYGLNTELMRQYAYVAFYSPLNTGTRDVMIWYRHDLPYQQSRAWEAEHAGRTFWAYDMAWHLQRLGQFMVQLDPETGETVSVSRLAPDTDEEEADDQALLLARPAWNADDLNEWYTIMQDYVDFMTRAEATGEMSDELLEMISDRKSVV